jgi:signal transduction histidine kinase
LNKLFHLALLLAPILLTSTLQGQKKMSPAQFDSLYDLAIVRLGTDRAAAMKCVETLSAATEPLSDIQRARLSYLQMKLKDTVSAGNMALEINKPPHPGSPGYPDSLQRYARLYLERSMPDMAIPFLMKALELLPANAGNADHARIELCEAYRQKQEYHKGVTLIENLLERQSALTERNAAYAYNRLAALYNEWGKPAESYRDSVIKYSRLCLELSKKTGDKPSLAAAQNELSLQYLLRKEYVRALELSQQAVSNFLSCGMPFQAMNALILQSTIYLGQKQYRQALGALQEATQLASIWENRNLYMRIYYQYANIYTATGDYREASGFLVLCLSLQTEFFGDRMNKQIVEQSARYDLFVKEQKIREEQKKNEYNHRQIIFLIIISITLILAFVFSLFYFRLKRQGALKQKLIEAVVETENNERSRIARDLHDGLGPVLSAINHYFQAFLDTKPEHRDAIRNRLQMVISEAIDEVSRISHNISPHVLEKHGLVTALNNFLAPLKTNEKYEISFTSGFDERLDPKIELTVYRCITELINNTLKHAEATRISLDIEHSEGKLAIRYSDNGKGFTAISGKRMGQGIPNITNRVESFGGILSFVTAPNAGLSVYISMPL